MNSNLSLGTGAARRLLYGFGVSVLPKNFGLSVELPTISRALLLLVYISPRGNPFKSKLLNLMLILFVQVKSSRRSVLHKLLFVKILRVYPCLWLKVPL